MVVNSSVIILVMLSHFAVITTGGLHVFNVGGHSFYSDFYFGGGGGVVSVDGVTYTVSLPVEYNKTVLKNATLNLVSLINYLLKNDPVLTRSDVKALEDTRSLLISMLQSGVFDVNTLMSDERLVAGVYYRSLTKMRSDKSSLMDEVKAYLTALNSPGIPPKLEDEVNEVREQLKKTYTILSAYDYGVGYFYVQIYPDAEEVLKKAEFLVSYPEVYKELTTANKIYAYLDSVGLLNEEEKDLWMNKFSPEYVKFVRGLYVSVNVTGMVQSLLDYLNSLKEEAGENLMKAKLKVDGYTNPPFYQKGKYEREIRELQEELSGIEFKKIDNSTFDEVKTLVSIYKKSRNLPSEVGHKYILDVIMTILGMGVVIGIVLARFS